MKNKLWELLQLFAGEGGEGSGDGAGEGSTASVVSPDDDGRARLMALGVPENMLRKGRNYSLPRQERGAQANAAAPAASAEGQARAADVQEATPAEGKLSFEELLKQNPDYNEAAQEMMRQRVRKSKQAESDLELLQPMLQKYRAENGLANDLDVQSTVNHMMGAYSQRAMEMGVSENTVMEMDIRDRQAQEQQFQAHFEGLQQQAAEFQKVVPGFDLMQELNNPKFAQWTSPAVGMTVEQAFRALHGDEMNAALMRSTAQKTGEMYSNAIASGSMRPVENGSNSQNPSALNKRSYRDMSPEERIAFKKAHGLPV